MKVTTRSNCKNALTITSSLSKDEFLLEARKRFPTPSPFMEEFMTRFEAAEESDAPREELEVQTPSCDDVQCPECGAYFTAEAELEDNER